MAATKIAPVFNYLLIDAPVSATVSLAVVSTGQPTATITPTIDHISEIIAGNPTMDSDPNTNEDSTKYSSHRKPSAPIPVTLSEPTCGLTPPFLINTNNAGFCCISKQSFEHLSFHFATLKENFSRHVLQPFSTAYSSLLAEFFKVKHIPGMANQQWNAAISMWSNSSVSRCTSWLHKRTPLFIRQSISELKDALFVLLHEGNCDFEPLVLLASRTLRLPFKPEHLPNTLLFLFISYCIIAWILVHRDNASRKAYVEYIVASIRRDMGPSEDSCTLGMSSDEIAAVRKYQTEVSDRSERLREEAERRINKMPDMHHFFSWERLPNGMSLLCYKPRAFVTLENWLFRPACGLFSSYWEGVFQFVVFSHELVWGLYLPWCVKTSAVVGASIWLFFLALLGATLHAVLRAALYLVWAAIALFMLLAEQVVGSFPGQPCPLRTCSKYDMDAWMPEDDARYHAFYARLSQPIATQQPVVPRQQVTCPNHFLPCPEITMVEISEDDLTTYRKHEENFQALKNENTRLREARRAESESFVARLKVAVLDELQPMVEETTGGVQKRRTGFMGVNVLSATCLELETALESAEWRLAACQKQVNRLQGCGRKMGNRRKGVNGD